MIAFAFILQSIVLQIMHYAVWLVFHRNYMLVKTAQSYFVGLMHDPSFIQILCVAFQYLP